MGNEIAIILRELVQAFPDSQTLSITALHDGGAMLTAYKIKNNELADGVHYWVDFHSGEVEEVKNLPLFLQDHGLI